jgi:hypothetical protein
MLVWLPIALKTLADKLLISIPTVFKAIVSKDKILTQIPFNLSDQIIM